MKQHTLSFRAFCLLVTAVFALSLVACGPAAGGNAAPTAVPSEPSAQPTEPMAEPSATEESADNGLGTPDASLSALLDEIYAIKDPGIPVDTREVALSDSAWVTYYTGLSDADSALADAAIASEASIGSQAYSLVLLRAKSASDADKLAEAMLNGIDPRKWICVQADDIHAVACGDVVMLVLVDTQLSDVVTSQELVDAYAQVSGAAFSYDDTRTLEPFDANAAPGPL